MQCVMFVHGVGTQTEEPPAPFFDRITQAVLQDAAVRGTPPPALTFDCAYWADVTQPDQDELRRRLSILGWRRRFFVAYLGDAVAYSKLPYPPDKYGEIQARFAASLRRLSRAVETSGERLADLTVIAHSLGTVIASDGLYDAMKSGAFPSNLRLTNLVTLGSPVALYGLRYGLARFTKPVRPSVWINYYFPQDIIGYPLQGVNAAYAQAVTEDICLRPGGGLHWWSGALRWLIGWIAMADTVCSHSWYFTDRRVLRRLGRLLSAPDSRAA